jgi:GMP synthase-like glutamine amidotransferase
VSSERARRLWFIDPSTNNPEDEAIEFMLDGWPGESRLFRPALCPGDGPQPEDGYDTDGIVLMGSSSSVHDTLSWYGPLASWLAPVLAGEVRRPLLGICYGHQLIAHQAGGEVGWLNEERTKRLGIEETVLEGCRLLPGRRRLRVVVSHREEVKRLPRNYRRTARRPGVTNDGMEHHDLPIYSFQFHPEAWEEFATHVGLDPALLDDQVREDSRTLLGAFRQIVLDHR